MKRLMVGTAVTVFLLGTECYAQTGAGTPQGEASHAPQANGLPSSCVILKRIGRISRAERRLYSLGISGRQFRYVEGKLPEEFSAHSKMTSKDVSKLQAHGAQVLVLESHYTAEDLKEARANCSAEAGKTASPTEAKASPAPGAVQAPPVQTTQVPPVQTPPMQAPPPQTQVQAAAAIARTPTASRKTDGDTIEAALVDVSSTPDGADVDVDGSLWGKTPSTMILTPGSHEIAVRKSGFHVWKKRFKLSSGHINVKVELVPKGK